MEKVHIALPSDENYLIGLTATAGSIAHHASCNVVLCFHILDGGIKDDSFNLFTQKIQRLHPHTEFSRIKVDEALFKDFPVWSGNRMTYARLMLADALPDVKHIIYSDTDFLWLADIAELWELRKDDVIFASTIDQGGTIERESAWANLKGLDFDRKKYFCAGLSFYNLELFRKENIIGQVADFLNKYPDVPFADQTAMNHLLKGRWMVLEDKWQTLSMNLSPENIQKPLAIHFAGDGPWTRNKLWTWAMSDACLLWFAMVDYINQVPNGTTIKCYYTCWQRFYKRSLAIIYKNIVTMTLFNALLNITGRKSYINLLNDYCPNLHINRTEAYKRVTRK